MKFRKIKLNFIVLVLFLFSCVNSSGQENLDNLINQIKMECEKVNREAKTLKVIEEDIEGLSSEGGLLKKFYDGKVMKKAELTFFGETGQLTSQYYFLNGELIFAKSSEERYKEPMYMGKTETDSLNKNEFYFKNQILVRWIDNNGKIVEQTQYLQKQIEILDDLKIINQSASKNDQ